MPTIAQIVQRNQEQVDHIDNMLRGLENEFALPVSVPTDPKLKPDALAGNLAARGEVRAGTAKRHALGLVSDDLPLQQTLAAGRASPPLAAHEH